MNLKFVHQEGAVRLDLLLCQRMEHCSRRLARKACEQGAVLVNGKPAKSGYFVHPGDCIEVLTALQPAAARPELARKEGKLLEVLFEDDDLLAVNKPRLIHCVTNNSDDPLTIADYVAAYCDNCCRASDDLREAGLVQRLDYFTSGVVVAAKTKSAWNKLHQALLGFQVEKTYLCLVEGELGSRQSHASFVLKQIHGGKKMKVFPLEAASVEDVVSHTDFETLGTLRLDLPGCTVSLLRAAAQHVSRHQIRIHASAIGHPLVGDTLYGARLALAGMREAVDLEESVSDGFLLHAESISFAHPATGEKVRIEVTNPLMEKLKEVLD